MRVSRSCMAGGCLLLLVFGEIFANGLTGDTSDARQEPTAKGWAYTTPVRPPVPVIPGHATRNPIDAFLLAKLREKGLSFSPPADPATLIRRVTLDLTGLPPTPEETEAFVQSATRDPQPAIENLVNRLLASPRHGERWAMFWLDLVRYAESDGFKADDTRPQAWRYRDYVIKSLNEDKPYDRFLREQLAGDELYPGNAEALVATGLHRNVPYEFNAVNLEQKLQDALNDITDITSSVFLGLTVGCARCHDHKFDPITQEDYYRLQAFFAGVRPREVPVGKPEEMARYHQAMQAWEAKTADLRKEMNQLEEPARKSFTAKRKARFPREYQAVYDLPPEKRSPREQQIAELVAKQVDVTGAEVVKSMKPDAREKWQAMNKQMEQFNRDRPALPQAMALSDIGPVAPTTYLLKRGDWRSKGKEVPPGFLSAIEDRYAAVPPPAPDSSTPGRRGVLAQWLTRADHPLTARVIVNRLWMHHFGRGIVGTPSDFGVQGEPPTHPELLDWLARELVESGWSLKHIHRLMVTSAAYQQSSQWNEKGGRADPENRGLWRMNRRRLEGETLRDTILAVNAQLNLKQGGPSVYPELPSELGGTGGKWPISKDAADRSRRSVYVFVKRNLRYPLFEVYDAPDTNESCARRHVSTNAPQALMLLNSKLMLDQAKAFADRVVAEAGSEPAAVVDRAFRLALGRAPDETEKNTLRSFLEQQTESATPGTAKEKRAAAVTDLCHVILNLNEFLYID